MRIIKLRKKFQTSLATTYKYVWEKFGESSADAFEAEINNILLIISILPEIGIVLYKNNYIYKNKLNIFVYSFNKKEIVFKVMLNTRQNWKKYLESM
jgi:glutamate synthase domain-containing protein 1